MKHTLISIILIVFAATPCVAQWNNIILNEEVTAFGVQDSFLYIAVTPPILGVGVFRYTVAQGYHNADSGIDWTQGNITSFASLGNYVFAGMTLNGGPGAAYRTSDNGQEWVLNASWNIGTNGTYLFGSSSTSVYRSTDTGNDWISVPCPDANNFATIGIIIFASGPKGLWRSIDTGNHWTQLSTPLVGTMLTQGTLLFITSGGKVISSSDSGTKWDTVAVDSGTVKEYVNCLATDGKNLFAGTLSGVFVSLDSGKSWIFGGSGLAGPNIAAIAVFDTLVVIDVAYGFIQEGDREDAEYTRPIRQLTDTTPASVAETVIQDSIGVFPNPANRMVAIYASSSSILSVSVLNVLGTDVLDIPKINSATTALDLSKCASGTYLLRIQTVDGFVLRKITLER